MLLIRSADIKIVSLIGSSWQLSCGIPVMLDSGIRRGTDVLMALALGAKAVFIGRPYIYGLAVGGAKGVERVISILRDELERAMALTGRYSLAEIDGSVLWKKSKTAG